MEIFTIGFTRKTAAEFFESLKRAGIKRLIDIRLNNRSQLAGFTKAGDLGYFLRTICGAEHLHLPILAPPKDLLDAYRKKRLCWEEFEARFVPVLAERKVEELVDRKLFEAPTVLLCSETEADRCHRRLVAEYLCRRWGEGQVTHL
jgi:uncharacterized protein (DUF488 family)